MEDANALGAVVQNIPRTGALAFLTRPISNPGNNGTHTTAYRKMPADRTHLKIAKFYVSPAMKIPKVTAAKNLKILKSKRGLVEPRLKMCGRLSTQTKLHN